LGDCRKAREKLNWVASTQCRELAQIMVDHDLEIARNEATQKSLM
jgi:GDPmannose 4,6-dehydratase